jgi:hypothetical protein
MAEIPAEQQAHREAFGRAITIWFKQNGWSQQTLHDFSLAIGNTGGVWNSQASLLQRGRLDCKPQFWVALGTLNAAIAAQGLAAVTSRSLRDRLTGAEPFLAADGRVATATDFFAMFIGEQPINDCYLAPEPEPVYSDDEGKGLSEMCREAFRRIAQDMMLSPREAWDGLRPHCKDMSSEEVARFREVLAGWSDWSGEEVTALSVPGQLGKPAQALEDWGDGNLTISLRPLRRG